MGAGLAHACGSKEWARAAVAAWSELLPHDDTEVDVSAAREAGMAVLRYRDLDELRMSLALLLTL